MNHINIAITAAFMWEGVKEDDALLEHWGQGCYELCYAVAEFAELSEMYLDAVFTVFEKDFPGVYDYDVSEPFGAWLRKHIEAQDPAGERGAPQIYKHIAAAKLYCDVWDFFMAPDYKRTAEEEDAVSKAMCDAQEKWLKARG